MVAVKMPETGEKGKSIFPKFHLALILRRGHLVLCQILQRNIKEKYLKIILLKIVIYCEFSTGCAVVSITDV